MTSFFFLVSVLGGAITDASIEVVVVTELVKEVVGRRYDCVFRIIVNSDLDAKVGVDNDDDDADDNNHDDDGDGDLTAM